MYCTVEEAKARGATGTEAEITAKIEDVQGLIDFYCKQTFTLQEDVTVKVELLNGVGFFKTPCVSVSSVRTVDGSDITGFEVVDNGDQIMVENYSIDEVIVVGDFGYSVVPDNVRKACARAVAELSNNTVDSVPSNVSSLSVEGFSISYKDSVKGDVAEFSNAVKALLADYRREFVGVW